MSCGVAAGVHAALALLLWATIQISVVDCTGLSRRPRQYDIATSLLRSKSRRGKRRRHASIDCLKTWVRLSPPWSGTRALFETQSPSERRVASCQRNRHAQLLAVAAVRLRRAILGGCGSPADLYDKSARQSVSLLNIQGLYMAPPERSSCERCSRHCFFPVFRI